MFHVCSPGDALLVALEVDVCQVIAAVNASGLGQEGATLSEEQLPGHLYRTNLGHGGRRRTAVAHRCGCLVIVAF